MSSACMAISEGTPPVVKNGLCISMSIAIRTRKSMHAPFLKLSSGLSKSLSGSFGSLSSALPLDMGHLLGECAHHGAKDHVLHLAVVRQFFPRHEVRMLLLLHVLHRTVDPALRELARHPGFVARLGARLRIVEVQVHPGEYRFGLPLWGVFPLRPPVVAAP